jgi:glycosyltransferase involved in cell wall biosynthesis
MREALHVFSTARDLLDVYGADATKATLYKSTILESPPEPTQTASREGVRLGFVGRLSQEKNPLLFVDIVSTMQRRGHAVQGILIGSGVLAGQVARRIQADDVPVDMLGWLDEPHDLYQRIAECDLVLVTSIHEGSPKILVEAMACGAPPLIAATNDVIDAYVDGGGVVRVASLQFEDWISAIERSINLERLEALRRVGMATARGLTLAGLSSQIAEVYSRAILPTIRCRGGV